MKFMTRIAAAALSACLLVSPGAVAFADQAEDTSIVGEADAQEDVLQNLGHYGSSQGTVVSVTERENDTLIVVKHEEGGEAHFLIDAQTYVDNREALEEGALVFAFFAANKPMTLQYPARYQVEVLAVAPTTNFVAADIFDADLLSQSNSLKLNIDADSETLIVDRDGNPFEGELGGQKLLVYYDIATFSLPPQTPPVKVVVLGEQEEETSVQPQAFYSSFTGTVTAIREHADDENVLFVSLENEEGSEATFVLREDVVLIDFAAADLEVGDVLVGFYDGNRPMTMIYPPQYPIEAVAKVVDEIPFIKADIFDADLVSQDHTLKLNIGEDTVLLDAEGKAYEGELANCKLVVFYAASTRSIPAQTTPIKVIVLGAAEVEAEETETPEAQKLGYYVSLTGSVEAVEALEQKQKEISITTSQGGEAVIVISPSDTFVVNAEELEVGAELFIFVKSDKPMTMQYPARYQADIVVVNPETMMVKADMFDENLLSQDGSMIVRVSEETEIVDMDGTAFTSDLADKQLVVFYNISAESYPEQALAEKIIVMLRPQVEDPSLVDPEPRIEEPAELIPPAAHVFVDANQTFVNEAGVQMVAVRAVAEQIGYEVAWNNETRSVAVGEHCRFSIGSATFTSSKGDVTLAAEAVIVSDITFVPVEFFAQVLEFEVSVEAQ